MGPRYRAPILFMSRAVIPSAPFAQGFYSRAVSPTQAAPTVGEQTHLADSETARRSIAPSPFQAPATSSLPPSAAVTVMPVV